MYIQEEEDIRKGPWTLEEDMLLTNYINLCGEGRWNSVAKNSGLKRSGKSCRLRWINYLRPDLKRGNITPQEERLIIDLQNRWGNRWSRIARRLPGRTDNEIKNYWRTRIKRKLGTGNPSSEHSIDSSSISNPFLMQNSEFERYRVSQAIVQQNEALNKTVLHFGEQPKEDFVLNPIDSIKIPSEPNQLEGSSGVFETTTMPFELDWFAAMVSELYADTTEHGGMSQFIKF
ncbi:hypothetical protein SUGI_0120300 [Cryptomeria japonica]|uniref:MYB-like transcription factor EOBI n=1 Tax=Cryptomeria japonica TaxID=3369 RepID=UPI002408A3A9|nr:MYB-like transcription factor EOBI [Cryptomeria japonica]GLJ10018.1 hypothetical protein SUGI_0120300 [Cryptomeria japonica]